MGCPTECDIGDNLVFSICTHDPDTGVLTDAGSAPEYWVYEEENTTEILTGNMAKFDSKTGHYTELIAVTTGNGFEVGKTYTIFIDATVDSDTGGICYAFKAKRSDSGPGAITFTYTLTSTVGGTPIPGADVWASTDAAGNYVVASGVTNASGEVVFYLDADTYYIWRQLAGWDFTNPDTEVVA